MKRLVIFGATAALATFIFGKSLPKDRNLFAVLAIGVALPRSVDRLCQSTGLQERGCPLPCLWRHFAPTGGMERVSRRHARDLRQMQVGSGMDRRPASPGRAPPCCPRFKSQSCMGSANRLGLRAPTHDAPLLVGPTCQQMGSAILSLGSMESPTLGIPAWGVLLRPHCVGLLALRFDRDLVGSPLGRSMCLLQDPLGRQFGPALAPIRRPC